MSLSDFTSSRSFLRQIDLASLDLFVLICECGSIARAAEHGGMVASAVSKRIAELESLARTPLLLRHARGVRATPAGQLLLEHARTILLDVEHLRDDLIEYARGVRGLVRLSANASAVEQFLPEHIAQFAQRHPDIRIDLPLPTERLAYFDPDWNPGNTILMHREPHGIWRVDYQLPLDEDPQDALRPESLKARIDAQLAMIGFAGTPWRMDWSSVYSARALTLPDYVHGSVVFCGDAAHMLPIFGVRGANTGFQDAQALAWRLALVARGVAPRALLATYSSERVGAAREIVEEAGKSTRFMAPPTRGYRLLRDAVLSLSLSEPFVGPLFHWRTSRPHAYEQSQLNSTQDDNQLFEAGPGHGAPPQNVRLGEVDFLLDHLGGHFDLLYFPDGAAVPAPLQAAAAAARARGVPLRIIAVSRTGDAVAGADLVLQDRQGRCRLRYGVPAAGAA
ncbi:MAG: FAD-dependent monooxygenase, partial [Comamonas sp.]